MKNSFNLIPFLALLFLPGSRHGVGPEITDVPAKIADAETECCLCSDQSTKKTHVYKLLNTPEIVFLKYFENINAVQP